MSASSYVGTILPQFGVLAGAKVFINGVDVTPTSIRPKTPTRVGRNGRGRPFWQGTYGWVCTYDEQTLDEYQRLTSIFYPLTGTVDGTLVIVVLPWHDQAGRFVEATAYMEWPQTADIKELINGVTVELSSFRLLSESR